MSDPDAIIQKLRSVLEKDQGLAELLERSLRSAREQAEAELSSEDYRLVGTPIAHCSAPASGRW